MKMGFALSSFTKFVLNSKREIRLLMIGLDSAGKTTILYKLKLNEDVQPIPTVGFNVETVEYRNLYFTVWDIGGRKGVRQLWHHYFLNTEAIIFVVDSADTDRFAEAFEELHRLMERPEMARTILLVFANKQDLPGAANIAKITKALKLDTLKQPWHIQPISAKSGNGLYEALDILCKMLSKHKK